ncbi:uncharacterized protein LOC129262020 [Lytechinus pictus]|uniref:uncharacterized protein LOC129262020 n=1 Tax=Lytechinus pictus TaxID=7653 RepID=UPI00240D731C|nr:uncharacterized protein LOC129262020 [Lytechinus pictus]
MRQVAQALGWGGVFRAFLTLVVVPNLTADGLPLNPSRNYRTLDETSRTTDKTNDWNKSPEILGRVFTMQDDPASKGLGQSIADRSVIEEGNSLGIVATSWSVNRDDSHVMDELPTKILNKSTHNLMRSEKRTLLSELNMKTNLLSLVESLMAQRKGVQTYLQRSRRKRSRTALRFRRRLGTDEQTSANISILITTYQGLNLSSPSSSTINDSNSSGGANSSSESSWPSSLSWSSASSTYLEDDIHVNRTNSVPYNLDNRRLLRNRSSHFNISNFLRNTRCRVNISDLAPESNDTSRSRTRRGVVSEGCQVLNVNHGYIRVDQTGLVTTTWDGTDINSK